MTARKIENLADVQPGDTVTIKWLDSNGQHHSTIVGVARKTGIAYPHLSVGPVTFRADGSNAPADDRIMAWSATREVPDLPTTNGSVISDATVRGQYAPFAVLDDNEWFTPNAINSHNWHDPEYITAWTPAKIVPDGDPVKL